MIKLNNISGYLDLPNANKEKSKIFVCEQNSLEIKESQYIAIVGESGSGKSQLVKTICGLNEDYYKLTKGSIDYNFQKKGNYPPFKATFNSDGSDGAYAYDSIKDQLSSNLIYGKRIGMMFQNPSTCFNPSWNVREHFEEIFETCKDKMSKSEFDQFRDEVNENLFASQSKGLLDKEISQLSGGQKQRLVISLVVVQKPDLIVGDEIGTGIDLKIKRSIYRFLLEFRDQKKYPGWSPSLILISHDIGFAHKIVDRVVVMYRGTILQKINLLDLNSRKYEISNLLDSSKTMLHPYSRALFESVISKDYSVEVEVPNLFVKNDKKCSFINGCVIYKEKNDSRCSSGFIDELKTKKADTTRCIYANEGIDYPLIDNSDFDWIEGWAHLEKEAHQNTMLEVDFEGHVLGSGKNKFYLHRFVLLENNKEIKKKITLRKNEILGIIGESGSGKTTLGKIIAGYPGYEAQGSTKIRYFDENDVTYDYRDPKVRERLQYPLQIIHQIPKISLNGNMTVKESLIEAFKVGYKKSFKTISLEEIEEDFNRLRITLKFSDQDIKKKVSDLSGGQQRRLGIGRIFASKPRIIIADEPVASLDSVIKNGIFELLTNERESFMMKDGRWLDRSMILISHDLKSVDRYCSRILIMEKGKILEEIINDPGPGFVCSEDYTKELYDNYKFFAISGKDEDQFH